ncbi:pyrroloquinoline quinone biosynthesis protein PqqF [Pseudomonas sp. G34]|uniref:pyrroloquinoline quinone biosynthesis protein PqqF n=1 Tax=Pseudomonas sp. G34 TaxID=3059083 RepID=UPI0028095AF2|nr:pyrroloquinoline quinone biosynthesis protein PqqF [Pseudomonas sp. G34]MDQ7983508.1 pyrroloquinoline quinone biosynthesis protein PqqF [Pseudomonas sp. G34]
MPRTTRQLTLANGLQLNLRHAPHLKRSAAALRIHAGSHDAPARWPGLAHFLEHLLFLGTARFPLADGLMRHVQRLGGEVNASTAERHTDFFCEVPPGALDGALLRLCDMLAAPLLDLERQRREREVIHAEFIAWSRDRQAQRRFALLQAVSPRHPLSGFQAGNRYSLPLQASAFQQALRGYHQRFYQAGQITLSLTGPQPLDELEQLARRHAALFAGGTRLLPAAPVPLRHGPLRLRQAPAPYCDLLFAHQALPAAAPQALELLLGLLRDSRPGGWLAELRRRGWLQACSAQPLYAHAGQLLWHIELQLTPSACANRTQALLHGWLGFIRQQDLQRLNAAFGEQQRHCAQAASALQLARRDSAGQPLQELDQQGLEALGALLDDLPRGDLGSWQLPADEPLLAKPAEQRAPLPAGLVIDRSLPASRQFAALYLRWQIDSPLGQGLQVILEHALSSLRERAEQAALQLAFTAAGQCWQLRISGLPDAVIHASGEALQRLRHPARESWHASVGEKPAAMPIRALLEALPTALQASAAPPQPACTLDQALLDGLWQQARWQGLAIGFDEARHGALGAALHGIMGQAHRPHLAPYPAERRWLPVDAPAEQAALLLFCPLPTGLQAAGRLLGHLLQGPVYQRLRVELQLGYAVFSGFRQVAGHGGLLFGVQSPHTGHGELLGHLLTLLGEGVHLDPLARQQLAEQFDEPAMGNAEVADWAWQTHLAGEEPALPRLRSAILGVEQACLDALLQQLLDARHGWLCLANQATPPAGWSWVPAR